MPALSRLATAHTTRRGKWAALVVWLLLMILGATAALAAWDLALAGMLIETGSLLQGEGCPFAKAREAADSLKHREGQADTGRLPRNRVRAQRAVTARRAGAGMPNAASSRRCQRHRSAE